MLHSDPRLSMSSGDPEDKPTEPALQSALAETLLLLTCLASAWPLMLGWPHWFWFALACLGIAVLLGLLVRRIRRIRLRNTCVPPNAVKP